MKIPTHFLAFVSFHVLRNIHRLWNKFDNRFMRGVFGGKPHEPSMPMDPNLLAAQNALASQASGSLDPQHPLFPVAESAGSAGSSSAYSINNSRSSGPMANERSSLMSSMAGRGSGGFEESKSGGVGGVVGGTGAEPPKGGPSGGQPI